MLYSLDDENTLHKMGVTTNHARLELLFREGQADRRNGEPCKSANGAYLNGWYAPDEYAHYIPRVSVPAFNKWLQAKTSNTGETK